MGGMRELMTVSFELSIETQSLVTYKLRTSWNRDKQDRIRWIKQGRTVLVRL